jgi:putative DNA primase/helicase
VVVGVVTDEFGPEWVGEQFADAPVGDDAAAPKGPEFPSPADPLAVARQLIEVDHLHDADGVLVMRWWRGDFYTWTGTHWAETADAAVRKRAYHALEHAQYWKADKDGTLELVRWAPTRRKVGDVLEALQAVMHLGEQVDPPAWVDGDGGDRLLALRNGLLDLAARKLVEHTPRLFNLLSLPYDYDPDANEPSRWLAFLDDLWPDDPESISLLQEWFGYVLSGETNLHKILLLVGPPRSGKGTIARVLTALVGKGNTAGPTLASLGTNFGLSPLLGKTLAVIADARLGGPNTFTVVERLLSISGEDTQTVDRKYKEPWTGRISARFAVISNELPDLGDASGAIATRFLVLTLTKSWLDQENPRLTDELLDELAGILRWSLVGRDRLREQGHFTEPATSRDAVTTLADLASPVAAFVRQACRRGPGLEVPVRELYQAWRRWSRDHGRARATTEQVFGRDLRAAVPGLKVARPRDGDAPSRPRHYEGIALSDAYAAYMGTAHNGDVRGPSRTTDEHGGPVRSGPRSEPLWAAPEADPAWWACDQCWHETTTDMTGFRHDGCGGLFRGVAR